MDLKLKMDKPSILGKRKVSMQGKRGMAINIPKKFARRIGLQVGDAFEMYLGIVNHKPMLALIPTNEAITVEMVESFKNNPVDPEED